MFRKHGARHMITFSMITFSVPVIIRSAAIEMQLHLIPAFAMPRGLQIHVIIFGCIANAPELAHPNWELGEKYGFGRCLNQLHPWLLLGLRVGE